MTVVINKDTPKEIIDKLISCGIKVVKSMKLSNIESSVATHPDIQLYKLTDNSAVCPPESYEYYREQLPDSINIKRGYKNLFGTYPNDCAYNVAKAGEYILTNTKYTDKSILEFYGKNNINTVHVNQGYTACNSLIIGKTLLTEDVGIHNMIMVNNLKLKTVLLPKGEIPLTGFAYGFIGGAAGNDGKNIYWYGTPEKLSYHNVINKVLKEEGVNSIALSSEAPKDLGGIICFP